MDRTQVANMKPTLAKSLNKWAMDALKRELLSLNGKITVGSIQESLFKVLTEVLSRLTFKLESADLQEAFSLAVELHGKPGISSQINLHKSCEPWFKRLFEAADDRQLLAWLPVLIRFSLHERNLQSENSYVNHWPDPLIHFPRRRACAAKGDYPELLIGINEATEWLLKRAKSELGEGRRKALMRSIYVFDAALMTKEQQKSLGVMLWEKTTKTGLPDLPNLHCFYYLDLPAPAKVDVVSKVKEHILTTPISDLATEEPMILNAAPVSKPVVQLPEHSKGSIEWSSDEIKKLWDDAIKWWGKSKVMFAIKESVPFAGTAQGHVEDMCTFLVRAVLPNMKLASTFSI